MRVDHIPDGSFRRILENRKRFPEFRRSEIIGHKFADLTISAKTEILNLNKEPQFDDLCDFVSAICNFLRIPPLNLHWIPQSRDIRGILTRDSNTIILTGPLSSVIPHVIDALIAHEMAHGMQGDLERAIMRGGELEKDYTHRREYQSDSFGTLMGCWQGTVDMLFLFWTQKNRATNDNLSSFYETETHPNLQLRSTSSISMDQHPCWQEYLFSLKNPGPVFEAYFLNERGVNFLTPEDAPAVFKMVESSPYYKPGLPVGSHPRDFVLNDRFANR
jgi:hypothetical protein